ncbi:hypothetical protein RsoM2USA_404 [Ralstonia phage RsoM2USA]|nr:hypothetical protein RsoM2USA_404 [Ralstonia phage RsoM2USA]
MTTFKEYLTEMTRSERSELVKSTFKGLTKDQTLEYVKTHCKKALADFKAGRIMFRGIKTKDEYGFINPSSIERQSANTYNLYNIIISESSNWAKYPKRNKSAICTIDTWKAQRYSYNGMPHMVFPVDGFLLGVCPDHDIYVSFNHTLKELLHIATPTLRVFNGIVLAILVMSGVVGSASTDFAELLDNGSRSDEVFHDAAKVKHLFSEFDRRYAKEKNLDKLLATVKLSGDGNGAAVTLALRLLTNYKGDLWKLCSQILDPTANDFVLLKNQIPEPGKSKEVWTDSDCIVIEATDENIEALMLLK